MRVALVTTNLQPNNGWATLAVKRGAALQKLGVDVVALARVNDPPPDGIAPQSVHRILPGSLIGGAAALGLLQINPLVRRLTSGCDLIDVVAEPASLACITASLSRPLVVTACGSYIPIVAGRGLLRGVYRQLFRRARLHAISDYTAMRVSSALGLPTPPVIIPGVDYDFFQPPRPRPEKRSPTVLCVAAPKKRKGIHVLIDAIALARQSIPDVQCIVVGALAETGYVAHLREQIAGHRLEDQVRLAGHLPYEEIVGWYQTADVFVLPSLSGKTMFEGFGLVCLEANACGLPAIGTRDSGNESAVIDEQTGFLVEQRSPEALAGRIVEVLSDRALRERLSRGAREFARTHNWERSATDVLSFYHRVLDARGRQEAG